MLLNKRKKIIHDIVIAIGLIVFAVVLQWWQPLWSERLEGIAYDFKLVHFSQDRPLSPVNIQIVDVDEASLKEIGRWPWPRRHLAQLVQSLTEKGAIVIAFDMLFSEAQQNPVDQVNRELKLKGLSLELSSVRSALDNDGLFAAQIDNNDVILGSLLQQDSSLQKGSMLAPSIIQTHAEQVNGLHEFSGYNASIDKLNNVAKGQGFINAMFDADGFLRKAALLSKFQGKFYPALALETFRIYSFAEQIVPQLHAHDERYLFSGIRIGREHISTDGHAQILIPYHRSAKLYQYTSAASVINHKVTDKRFESAVVFVGTSAVGMADLRATPISLVLPGVEIHAAVFDALTQPNIQPVRPDWWLGFNVVLLLVTGILLGTLLPRLSPSVMTISALLFIAALIIGNLSLWYFYRIDLPNMTILMLSVSLFFASLVKGFYREGVKRHQVKLMFDQYVPPAHIDKILEDPQQSAIRGERKTLTVLFADIRNFTQISEQLSAQELTSLLNDFFTPITQAIFKHNGTIDKYVGDMVMAFWGAPLKDENHQKNALLAAEEMLTVAKSLSSIFEQKGWPAIRIGIGINTGSMNVGDMGSKFRRSYTVIGDAVNLASRLESLTKYYGVEVLVGEETHKAADSFYYHIIDKVKVKGKGIPVTIYQPYSAKISQKQQLILAQFSEIFHLYQESAFDDALIKLNKLIEEFGESPLYLLYKQRLLQLIANPPSENWDGSYSHSNK